MLASVDVWFPAAVGLMASSVVLVAVLRWRQAARTKKALAGDLDDDRCIGCGGTTILSLGTHAFRCTA